MYKEIQLDNFTVFSSSKFDFSPGLNVFIGENATGKTHILKILYSILMASYEGNKERGIETPTKQYFEHGLAKKIVNVMRPDRLGAIVKRRGRSPGTSSIHACFCDESLNIDFSFTTRSEKILAVSKVPLKFNESPPIYLQTRELLTIYPNFVPTYDKYILEYDETYRDTCVLLGGPKLRGPRAGLVKSVINPIENIMDASVSLDEATGKFYLNSKHGQGNFEMNLVAEGWRKLATLYRLVSTGALSEKEVLFWDEPESNLNPKIIKVIAEVLVELARAGIQIFLATHSLFFLRELSIQLKKPENGAVGRRFFGLHREGEELKVLQGDTENDIGDIAALDEELSQSDRYLEVNNDA